MLLAEEAGALTSDFEGNPNYLAGDHVLCAAPKCFKPMLQAIKSNFSKKA
jgi:myo-inositol-1(or 4)-monophosphatase